MILLNFNLDDVHPEKGFGYFDEKTEMLISLTKMFKGIKISLFVTPNWIDLSNDPVPKRYIKFLLRKNFSHSSKGEPFRIDKPEFGKWVSFLNRYTRKGNFEILLHGYVHHRDGILHAAEFLNLGYEGCKEKLRKAETLFEKSGLLFAKGFRPPGWKYPQPLLRALREQGYRFISTRPSSSRTCDLKEIIPKFYDIPQNWSVSDAVEDGLKIVAKNGCLMAKAHISEWCDRDYISNGLTRQNFDALIKLIELLEKKFELKYVSLKEFVDIHAKQAR